MAWPNHSTGPGHDSNNQNRFIHCGALRGKCGDPVFCFCFFLLRSAWHQRMSSRPCETLGFGRKPSFSGGNKLNTLSLWIGKLMHPDRSCYANFQTKSVCQSWSQRRRLQSKYWMHTEAWECTWPFCQIQLTTALRPNQLGARTHTHWASWRTQCTPHHLLFLSSFFTLYPFLNLIISVLILLFSSLVLQCWRSHSH